MGDPSVRARPGREQVQAYGGAADDIAIQGIPATQGVTIVVSGTERVDHVPIRGSAGRVPAERAVTPTRTKEVRRAGVI